MPATQWGPYKWWRLSLITIPQKPRARRKCHIASPCADEAAEIHSEADADSDSRFPSACSPSSESSLHHCSPAEVRWGTLVLWVLLLLPPLFWGWSQSPGEALSGQMFLPRRWLPWRTVRAVSSRGAASPHTEQPSAVQSGLHSQSPCEGQHSWPCCCPRHEEVKHNVFAI